VEDVADAGTYVRSAGEWIEAPAEGIGDVPDNTGLQYVREFGQWVEASNEGIADVPDTDPDQLYLRKYGDWEAAGEWIEDVSDADPDQEYVRKHGAWVEASNEGIPEVPDDDPDLTYVRKYGAWEEAETIPVLITDITRDDASGALTVTTTKTPTSIEITTLEGTALSGGWSGTVFTPDDPDETLYSADWKVVVA